MGLIDSALTLFNPSRNAVIPPPRPAFDNLWPYINLAGGGTFPLGLTTTMPASEAEAISADFQGLVSGAYAANGVVFACMLARLMIFSEARFQFQRLDKGRPGDLFGDKSLDILEHPWAGGTTGDLLTQMIADADMAGNAFVTRRGLRGGRMVRMRPDWVTIVIGSPNDSEIDSWDLDAEVLGYVYHPGGRHSGRDPIGLGRDQVAHFRPIPDPLARFRGMSWLTPVIREIQSDTSATVHKQKFFDNGATPNLVVKRDDATTKEVFADWVALMEQGHAGIANAYKTLYLSAGADATVVGVDLKQLDFKVVQGAGETRIAAAAGIHPVIVGLSEGMQGSSLNAGNFNSARRLVADRTMSPLWRNVAGSLEVLVPPPPGSRLWWDGRDIPFLREDRKDAAEIQQIKAQTIRQYTDAGFTPDTAVKAVEAENPSLLKHSGLFSVQLQPPGTMAAVPEPPVVPASPNGKKPVAPGVKP